MKALIPALAILLGSASARADVGVVVTGEATMQPQLVVQLENWLKLRGHTVSPSPLDPDAINTLIDCFVIEDLGCARGVVEKRAKSQAIVFARVEVTPNEKDGTRDVALVGYWLQKGHSTIAERRICAHCDEKGLVRTSEDLMTALAADPATGTTSPGPTENETGPSHLVPGAVLGAGAALLVTGIVMIAIDGKPATAGLQMENYRDFRTPGYVLSGVGVAAIGAGIWLWLHQSADSAPVAAVSHGGGYIGWSGRF